MGKRIRKLRAFAAALLIAVLCFSVPVSGEDPVFSVSLPSQVRAHTPCELRIVSPFAGEAVLRLFDAASNLWLVLRVPVSSGENLVPWDGLGEFGEILLPGAYYFSVLLNGNAGQERATVVRFSLREGPSTLVYALPSSENLYLNEPGSWFVECHASGSCMLEMEIRQGEEVVWSRSRKFRGGDALFRWRELVSRKETPPAGDYTMVFRTRENPAQEHSFPLRISDYSDRILQVRETGPILPERGMTDAQIWEIMMKPSVVVDGTSIYTQHYIYEEPTVRSHGEGTVVGGTQALEVLGFDGDWAHVRAWSHKDGSLIEGYIRTDKLTVAEPASHYGILVDKREQTMTVYEDGRNLGTVTVSTGLAIPKDPARETPAGAFLTNLRMGASFTQHGMRYEYPLRYDGGNIIHCVGYTRSGGARDYTENLSVLGEKASHGCVRVSPLRTEGCNYTLYWLWSKVPYHTRVLILDDYD